MARTAPLNRHRPDGAGDYVLYWMIAARRPVYNFGLQRAAELARELHKPLVVLEALRCAYPWASPRLHQFVIDGMIENQAHFAEHDVFYHPYLERRPGEGRGLLEELGRRACAVVTDDFPCFFLPRMVEAAARQLSHVAFETVDSNGLLPLRAAPKVFERAVDFRRFLQRNLAEHLEEPPVRNPLRNLPPRLKGLDLERWPAADLRTVRLEDFSTLDARAQPVGYRGGFLAAEKAWRKFLQDGLTRYDQRNLPDSGAASGLSPYLHFGHLSPHQVFAELAHQEGWSPSKLGQTARGAKEGWWGMSEHAESFLDEMVTWRELGYNMCWQRDDYDRYESLPAWARATLEEHAGDERTQHYKLQQLEAAETYDEVWNAAQRQLLVEGRIHNYLRMLWGKKILEWSSSPREALNVMIELNNRYAVDGRNPNSYSGIFWCLGRYDRPWFERPIFGLIRYMSSESTLQKCKLKQGYLERWGGAPQLF